jgi:hypothetical protein
MKLTSIFFQSSITCLDRNSGLVLIVSIFHEKSLREVLFNLPCKYQLLSRNNSFRQVPNQPTTHTIFILVITSITVMFGSTNIISWSSSPAFHLLPGIFFLLQTKQALLLPFPWRPVLSIYQVSKI